MKPILALATLLFASASMAHGPTPQKVVETVEIAAPIDQVWNAVKDFGAIAKWNPALAKSESTGGNVTGEKRTLHFPTGEQLTEELDAYEPAAHEYTYRLGKENLKALPASSYSAVLKVTATEKGSQVEWKSRLYRGDTGNFPPDELNDEAAVAAMQKFFRAGLDNLKKSLESGR
ncbi:SRPBCC family protein [Methylococcus sp. ANG]|uniref:SRPBCC family protein n=1 Tax=Methylococcus sp. ANG TaxID=3231903 RepID=UPI0034597A6C